MSMPTLKILKLDFKESNSLSLNKELHFFTGFYILKANFAV